MGHVFRRAFGFAKEMMKSPGPVRALRYRDILFFAQFARSQWKAGATGLLLALTGAALSSLLPLGGKVLVDYAVMKKGLDNVAALFSSLHFAYLFPVVRHVLESINLVVVILLLMGITVGAIGIIQRYLMIRLQQEFTFALQAGLFDRLLRFPLSYFRRGQTGYLMARVSDDIYSLQVLFSESMPYVVARIFSLIFGLSVIFALNVRLALVSVSVVPAYALINYFFAGRLRDVSIAERETSARVSRDMQEVIAGVETIKAYAAEESEATRVSEGMRTVAGTRSRRMVLSLLSDYAAGASRFAATLLIMWFGAGEMAKGAMTAGDYVAFTSYALYLSGAANGIFMFHIMLQPVFASMGRLLELFNLEPEFMEDKSLSSRTARVKGEIAFRDVTFSYDGRRAVLETCSFSVKPGEIAALVGPSGAGKTTVVNLMLKFCTPQSGSIFLDGRDLNEIPPKWLREQIGVVTQEAFLFNESIEKNIRFGRPGATREEVVIAAKMANIHLEIERLADGYETVIGERGVKLSAGQRQRISIARAFLKNPPILIFDEPTSALDPEAEALVKESIRRLAENRTTFIIAHRHSTIEIAHKVLAIVDGKIVATGPIDELGDMGRYCTGFFDRT